MRELIRLGEQVPEVDRGREDDDVFNAELARMSEAYEREQRKRKRVERELDAMKARNDVPFLVPALLEAFTEIDKLTEHETSSTKVVKTRKVSRFGKGP